MEQATLLGGILLLISLLVVMARFAKKEIDETVLK
jgi:hypothetical protein